MTGHDEKRRKRINEIIQVIKKLKDKAGKESLIAECSLNWGTSRRTLLEYIKLLKDAGKIEEVAGLLIWKEE